MSGTGKLPAFGPGGGGGGAASNGSTGYNGGNGYAGSVEVIYGGSPAFFYNIVRFLMAVPSGGDVDGTCMLQMQTSGTVAKMNCMYTSASGGGLYVDLYDSSNTLILSTSSTPTQPVDGLLLMVGLRIWNNGGLFGDLETIQPGFASLRDDVTFFGPTFTMGEITACVVDSNGLGNGTAIGHVVVQYAYEDMADVSQALHGYIGEKAGNRFTRLCGEQGIQYETQGDLSTTPQMGAQPIDTFTNVLQEIEDIDRGLLYETRDQFGLGYRCYNSLTNQSPALVADYSSGQISQDFTPTLDELLTRNDITLSRTNGSSYNAIQTTGDMSIQDPPNGVGDISYQLTVNAYEDSQLPSIAAPILALGTVDDYRYPAITFDLTRTETADIFDDVVGLGEGDYVQITTPPAFLMTNPTIDQLVYGFTETISAYTYLFELNCVPESPYEV